MSGQMNPKRIFVVIAVIVAVTLWSFVIVRYEVVRLFTVFVPLALGINFARSKKTRDMLITLLVAFWLLLFHYESARHFYLTPIFGEKLYKTKFLFPPAGWIMFYEVGDTSGHREVYGIKDGKPQLIDPHDIFRTRTIGYDNIHRGILTSAAEPQSGQLFCRYLKYRFPYFDSFVVNLAYYPEMTAQPYKRYEKIEYQCIDQ